MDEQLKAKLVGYLDTIESKVKAGNDFVAAEAPLAVQEWLTWMAWESGIYAAACLVTVLVGVFTFRKLFRKWPASNHITELPLVCGMLACVTVGTITLIFGVVHGMQCAKVIVAPRVVVIEKVSELTGVMNRK
jgi:hypothetical protein